MEILEALKEYIAIAVLGICLCVGFIIKYAIPSEKINRFIPLIVGASGALLNIWANGWAVSPDILLVGLVSGLASTGMYEAFHQFLKKG
jgi:hypothetical protein